jgi:hypothetical protein
MRSTKLLLLPLALALLLAGCVTDEDIKETGISRNSAIKIAENHCSEYPDEYSYVDRAEWNSDGNYWLVALTDRDGDHGSAYKINRAGHIIDSHKIDRHESDDYYGSGPGHYWYYW